MRTIIGSWRFWCFAGLMAGVLFTSASAEIPADKRGQPAVICVNPVLDFGSVYSDAVVKHSYVLTNQGERVIKISGVRAGCGCTSVTVATNELAPGQTTTVDVVINFKGRRGRQNKSVYADVDDPQTKVVRMEFTGVVIVPIEAQPEGIHFGTIGAEGRLEREVLLKAVGTNLFQVLSARSVSPEIKVTFETREAGKQYLVKIVSDGPRKEGSFAASVDVETDHPQMKGVSIPVAGLVAGDIVASPANLLLTPMAANEPRLSRITLWSPSGKTFTVSKVDLPGVNMTNSVTKMMPDRCRLEIKSWGDLVELDGKSIRVETDLPSMKELWIPIKVKAVKPDNAGK